jgi:hypothetical protein
MNVSKFEGEFHSCQALAKELVKKYLQYDYAFVSETMTNLEYQGLSIKITQNNNRLLISTNGNEIEWSINEFILQNEFPQQIPVGKLNQIVNLPVLSKKLQALKEIIQQHINPSQKTPSTGTKNTANTKTLSDQTAADTTAKDTMVKTGQTSTSQLPQFPEQQPYVGGMPSYIDQQQHHIQNPFSIGNSDLDPFSAGNGVSGGMIMGPDHPLFNIGRGGNGDGSFGMFPKGSVPPGARFDPVSPFDVNIRPGQGSGGYHGPAGGNASPFGGIGIPGYHGPTGGNVGIPGYPGGVGAGPRRPGGGIGPSRSGPGHPSGDPDFDELLPPRFDDEFM